MGVAAKNLRLKLQTYIYYVHMHVHACVLTCIHSNINTQTYT